MSAATLWAAGVPLCLALPAAIAAGLTFLRVKLVGEGTIDGRACPAATGSYAATIAPSAFNLADSTSEEASRISSVFGLKAKPQTAGDLCTPIESMEFLENGLLLRSRNPKTGVMDVDTKASIAATAAGKWMAAQPAGEDNVVGGDTDVAAAGGSVPPSPLKVRPAGSAPTAA